MAADKFETLWGREDGGGVIGKEREERGKGKRRGRDKSGERKWKR